MSGTRSSLTNDLRVATEVVLLDGGTQGLSLLPHISGVRRLLVIDALDVGEAPGTLLRVEGKAPKNLPGKASVGPDGRAGPIGRIARGTRSGGRTASVHRMGKELTMPVREALDRLPDLVLEQLLLWTRRSIAQGSGNRAGATI